MSANLIRFLLSSTIHIDVITVSKRHTSSTGTPFQKAGAVAHHCLHTYLRLFLVICRHDIPGDDTSRQHQLIGTLVHHAGPSGLYQTHRVSMMHPCSNANLLVST